MEIDNVSKRQQPAINGSQNTSEKSRSRRRTSEMLLLALWLTNDDILKGARNIIIYLNEYGEKNCTDESQSVLLVKQELFSFSYSIESLEFTPVISGCFNENVVFCSFVWLVGFFLLFCFTLVIMCLVFLPLIIFFVLFGSVKVNFHTRTENTRVKNTQESRLQNGKAID